MLKSLVMAGKLSDDHAAACDYLLDEDVDRVSIYRFANGVKDTVTSTDYLSYKLKSLLKRARANNFHIEQLRETVEVYKQILASLKASLKQTC